MSIEWPSDVEWRTEGVCPGCHSPLDRMTVINNAGVWEEFGLFHRVNGGEKRERHFLPASSGVVRCVLQPDDSPAMTVGDLHQAGLLGR